MRSCLLALSLTLASTLLHSASAAAETRATANTSVTAATAQQPHLHIEGQPCTECANALRAQQIARLRYLIYFRSDHRLEMARLDARIRLVQEQLRSAKKLNANYRRLNGYWTTNGRPFPVTEERTRVAVVDLELQLKLLRQERLHALQNHQLQLRLRRLEIEQLVSALKSPIAVTQL